MKVELSNTDEVKSLMDSDQYSKFCEEEDNHWVNNDVDQNVIWKRFALHVGFRFGFHAWINLDDE